MLPFNMGVGGTSGVDTGDIGHSLRFRSGSYLTRTPGSSGSRRKLTVSMWVKRCALGVFQRTFGADDIGSTTFCVGFNTNNKLEIRDFSGSYLIQGISTQVFRDTTSFIHLVVAFDTDQAAFADGVKAYVNGTQITAWDTSTYSGVHDMQINDTRKQSFGVYLASGVPTAPYDYGLDYLARPCLVTGSQLTPSSFGYLNTEINEWVSKSQSAVKAVADAGGTNSFMLDFDNGTSLTTLGYDKSSKGNNWTLNNFSLTAGTSYDWMLDVPGNSFATLNPLVVPELSTPFSAGNLQFSGGGQVVGSQAFTQNSYFEYQMTNATPSMVGVCPLGTTTRGGGGTGVANSALYASGGAIYLSGSSVGTFAAYTSADVIGVQYELATGYVSFYKNNVFQATVTVTPGIEVSAYSIGNTGATGALMFGQAPLHASATYHSAAGGYFRYAPPTGFKALCQRNLPDPAITNPELHFDTVLYVGDGAASGRNIACGTSPDLAWIKSRSIAPSNHFLLDSVRGATKVLGSNQTIAEYTDSDFGLGVGQFTVGDNAGSDEYNPNKLSASYAAWLWKAGGAAVTNNAGSISSQVSANVTAGFSIVTYTGNLSSAGTATVGHGLGQAPGLIISKSRNNAGGDNGQWVARHKYLASVNHYLRLNTTDTPVDSSANGSMSASTSTVFSTNWTSGMNSNGGTYVAYCFAEIPGFSKIFSYTGNGSADGPFVHCGFKPKWVLIKRIDAANGWFILDAIRNTTNVCNLELYPNLADAEGANTAADLTSSGFKLRGTDAWKNANGGTYIGIAFADVPAKYSLAR